MITDLSDWLVQRNSGKNSWENPFMNIWVSDWIPCYTVVNGQSLLHKLLAHLLYSWTKATFKNIHTVNPALLTSSFVLLIQLSSRHISLFKVITMKYFTQGKSEFMNFLFVLLDKMKIFIFVNSSLSPPTSAFALC